jgi:hypothetical protein
MAMFNSHVSLPEGIVFAFFSKATNIGLSENGPSNFHALFIITAIPLLAIGWLHGYIIVFFCQPQDTSSSLPARIPSPSCQGRLKGLKEAKF